MHFSVYMFYEIFGMNCHSECYMEWNAIWITKADIGWISWGTLNELIGEVVEKTAFGVRDLSSEKRRKCYDMASRETLVYCYGLFCKKTQEYILKKGLFQIAIRSWLFIYSSLSYLRIWTQSTICVWESQETAGFSGIFLLSFVSDKFWRFWLGCCIKINPDCLQKALPCSPVNPFTAVLCKSCSPTKCDFFFGSWFLPSFPLKTI